MRIAGIPLVERGGGFMAVYSNFKKKKEQNMAELEQEQERRLLAGFRALSDEAQELVIKLAAALASGGAADGKNPQTNEV